MVLTLADYVNGKTFHPKGNEKLLCKREKYGKDFYVGMGGNMYAEHSSLTENGLIIRNEEQILSSFHKKSPPIGRL